MLFTDCHRTDSGPKTNRESEFAFIDRSARPEIERVRQFLEKLVQEYPYEEQVDLRARILSGDDTHFRSSVFELLLFGFLVRLGFSLRPHPELLNGSNRRPDFHVTAPTGEDFYLEAVLASPNNGTNPAAEARVGTTLDALTKASHLNFMVAVEMEGAPLTQPSGARLRNAALAWLDTLNPDTVQAAIDRCDLFAAPTFNWSHENWKVLLRAIPLSPEKRGKATTLIGVLDGGGGIIDEWTPIRNAITFKGSKYGHLDKPLLIAVNFASFHLDRIDEMQALYGQERFHFSIQNPTKEPRFDRAPNGAWYGRNGPQAKRVSGAWLFNDLNLYTVASRRNTVYFNPWAVHQLPNALKQLPHAIGLDGEVEWHDGISLKECFGFSEHWPQ